MAKDGRRKKQILVDISPGSDDLLKQFGISRSSVETTVNIRHRGGFDSGMTRFTAVHWFSDNEILFVESVISEKRVQPKKDRIRVHIERVSVSLALRLRPELPCGTINKRMDLGEIMHIVANSFGTPVTCHSSVAPQLFYNGPWDGQAIRGDRLPPEGMLICASLNPHTMTAECAWACDIGKYSRWLKIPQGSPRCVQAPIETWPVPGSFSDRMMQRSNLCTADVVKETSRLGPEHIEFLTAIAIRNQIIGGEYPTDTDVICSLTNLVVRFFFGDEWVVKNTAPHQRVCKGNRESRQFLRSDSNLTDRESMFRYMNRIRLLATYLYNFQGVPGIEHRIAVMKRDDDLESALGELECAALIAAPPRKLRFIIPQGRKGSDYEAEFTTPTGRIIRCEIKTKKETTPLSIKTVQNTCQHARRQLPKGSPGILFLCTPEDWVNQPFAKERVETGIDRVLRQSERLVAIVLVWQEFYRHGPDGAGSAMVGKFAPIYNKLSPHFGDDIAESITQSGRANNDTWLELGDYARANLARLTPAVIALLDRQADAENRSIGPPED